MAVFDEKPSPSAEESLTCLIELLELEDDEITGLAVMAVAEEPLEQRPATPDTHTSWGIMSALGRISQAARRLKVV